MASTTLLLNRTNLSLLVEDDANAAKYSDRHQHVCVVGFNKWGRGIRGEIQGGKMPCPSTF